MYLRGALLSMLTTEKRGGGKKSLSGGGRGVHTVFIPLCASSNPSSDSQIGSAHNV